MTIASSYSRGLEDKMDDEVFFAKFALASYRIGACGAHHRKDEGPLVAELMKAARGEAPVPDRVKETVGQIMQSVGLEPTESRRYAYEGYHAKYKVNVIESNPEYHTPNHIGSLKLCIPSLGKIEQIYEKEGVQRYDVRDNVEPEIIHKGLRYFGTEKLEIGDDVSIHNRDIMEKVPIDKRAGFETFRKAALYDVRQLANRVLK